VIEGLHGYSVAHYRDGIWVFARGDEVFGHFDLPGSQEIVSIGRVTLGSMIVEIRRITRDPSEAEALFREACAWRQSEGVS